MASKPSRALRALQDAVSVFPASQAVTWGQLQAKLEEAAAGAEDSEWQDYMGDDR